MKLLFVEVAFNLKDIQDWFIAELDPNITKEALENLLSFRIIVSIISESNLSQNSKYIFHPIFRLSFQQSLALPVEPWRISTEKIPLRNPEEINRVAHSYWGNFITFLLETEVKISNGASTQSNKYRMVAQELDLFRNSKLTAKGFEFVLKSPHHQIWELIRLRISTLHIELISFILMLSFCVIGNGYSMKQLTESQAHLTRELSQLGLLCIFDDYFFPSSFLIDFPSVTADPNCQIHNQSTLQIIVETNLQVVAYLQSELDFYLLRLFVEISVRLPNMACGLITREKFREAFRRGLKVPQIVDFLRRHPHSEVLRALKSSSSSTSSSSSSSFSAPPSSFATSLEEAEEEVASARDAATGSRHASSSFSSPLVDVLPSNVGDQLTIWQQEMDRLRATECCYLDFSSQALYLECQHLSAAKGLLLWPKPFKDTQYVRSSRNSVVAVGGGGGGSGGGDGGDSSLFLVLDRRAMEDEQLKRYF